MAHRCAYIGTLILLFPYQTLLGQGTETKQRCHPGVDIAAFELTEKQLKPFNKTSQDNPVDKEDLAKSRLLDSIADELCKEKNDPKCTDPDRECKDPLKCKATLEPRPQSDTEKKGGKFKPGEAKCKEQSEDKGNHKKAGWVCEAKNGWYRCSCRCRT